jgi:hypothetical protein
VEGVLDPEDDADQLGAIAAQQAGRRRPVLGGLINQYEPAA